MSFLARLRRSRLVASATLGLVVAPLLPPRTASAAAIDAAIDYGSDAGFSDLPSLPGGGGQASQMTSVDAMTGDAHASIPFALPTARGQSQPSLSLGYSSSAGDGDAGIGWRLGPLPTIERRGPSGLAVPTYRDHAPSASDWDSVDRFVMDGEPLVPVCEAGSSCHGESFPTQDLGGTGWVYYRRQNDSGSGERFFFTADHRTWLVQRPSGETLVLGASLDGRFPLSTDPVTASASRYHLVRKYDTARNANGQPANPIVYLWRGEQLTDIFDTPVASATSIPDSLDQWAHHTHVNYGPYPHAHAYGTPPAWIRVPTMRVLGVDVTSATFSSTTREMVRRYYLSYVDDAQDWHHSRLLSVEREGRCPLPVAEGAGYTLAATNCARLPRITFKYTSAEPSSRNELPFPGISGGKNHSIVDLNADGLPDVITAPEGDIDPSGVQFYLNTGSSFRGIGTQFLSAPGWLSVFKVLPGFSAVGDFLGDGQANLLAMRAPWLRDERAGDSMDAADPPYTLDAQALSFHLSADARTGLMYATPAGFFSWALRSTPQSQMQTACRPVDVNGDGLVDCLAGEKEWWSRVDDPGNGFQNEGVLFSTKDRSGHIAPLGFTSVSGTPAQLPLVGVAVAPNETPWEDAVRDWSWRDYNRAQDGKSVASSPYTMADMDGDGLSDIVVIHSNDITYWRNHGDGWFGEGVCTGTPAVCAYDLPYKDGVPHKAYGVTMPLPFEVNADDSKIYVQDLNADGFGDLVYGLGTDIKVLFYKDGHWSPPVVMSGIWDSTMAVAFADMNASGSQDLVTISDHRTNGQDLVYVDFLSDGLHTVNRPGLLTSVDNGRGGTEEIQYSTIPQLWKQNLGGAQAWRSTAPFAYPVATSIVARNNLAAPLNVNRQTVYDYRDAVFDARERVFRGFGQVTTTHSGDPGIIPSRITVTTYAIGTCPVQQGKPCAKGVDDPYQALRGVPVIVETHDDGNATSYFSTVHHQYQVRPTYQGLDGRVVRITYAEQTDSWVYDTAGTFNDPNVLSAYAQVTDVNATQDTDLSATRTLAIRANAGLVHVKTTRHRDDQGNVDRATDYGIVDGGPVDTPISASTTFQLVGSAGNWIYRRKSGVMGYGQPGALVGKVSESDVAYDAYGNVTSVTSPLGDVQSLWRSHEDSTKAIAPVPANASQPGTVVLARYANIDRFNNVGQMQGPNGRCTTVVYDPLFAQLPTSAYVAVGAPAASPCAGSTWLTTAKVFDRGLEAVTSAFAPDNTLRTIAYDSFGRVHQTFQPDPALLSTASTSPISTIDYFIGTDGIDRVRQRTLIGHGKDVNGNPTDVNHEAWVYRDGLGETIATIQQADTTAGDSLPWLLSGFTTRAETGQVLRTYRAQAWNGDPAAYYPSQAPSTHFESVNYDAYGRVLTHQDVTGAVDFQSVFHAVTSEVYDKEDLAPSSPHFHTPMTERIDGHHRPVAVVTRAKIGGQLDEITTAATYNARGQEIAIQQTHSLGSDTYQRTMDYDSLGRMVRTVEPNTSVSFNVGKPPVHSVRAWTYAYDDAGDLVGTSDARGCGKNLAYDAAGRLLAEDFSPCLNSQPLYSPPDLTSGNGTEAFYVYDHYDGTILFPHKFNEGRLTAVRDRASWTWLTYDGRGETTHVARRIAKPTDVPDPQIANRYAPWTYQTNATFDEAGRLVGQTTGADAPELLDANGASAYSIRYSTRGTLAGLDSTYGPLVRSATFDPDGRPLGYVLGDTASTTASYAYDHTTERLTEARVARSSALPAVLQDDVLASTDYDLAGNPLRITDGRDGTQWSPGAKPVNRTFVYDDLYRVTEADYSAEDSSFTPPLANVAHAAPSIGRPTRRVRSQTYSYDWLGNIAQSGDEAGVFVDRSLGTETNGGSGHGPHQLVASSSGANKLAAQYDAAGNLTHLTATYSSANCPTSAACQTDYQYDWDEVGRLSRARRWDPATPYVGGGSAAADVLYAYDAGNQRVLSTAKDPDGTHTTAEVFASLRLEGTTWNAAAGDYDRSASTEAVYVAGVGRVFYSQQSLPTVTSGKLHVLLEVPDHLGSTSTVIDKETSELVERSTYMAYGAAESDYRSPRWANFREAFRFTGKEDDVRVGVTYFGQRYYSAAIHRWISPDPLTIHGLGADINPYAYVGGRVSTAVDPFGLDSSEDNIDIAVTGEDEITVTADKQPAGGPALDHTFMDPDAEEPSAKPEWEPAVSDPAALAQAEGQGRIQRGDLRGFWLGMFQQPVADAQYAGANQLGREFGRNIALEATGAILLKVAARGIELTAKAGRFLWENMPELYGLGGNGGGTLVSGGAKAAEGLGAGAQTLSREATMWEAMGQLSHGGGISADTALESGAKWVGEGYTEVAPGVFRSSDGLRQFRMMTEDLVGAHGDIGPHVHFESLNPLGRVIENNHVPLLPDVPGAP